jgi:CRISPR/Cas system-associated protein Csx1
MSIKCDISESLAQFKQLAEVPDRVIKQAYKFFVNHTPVRTGNARRRTSLESTTIYADYPYAGRLDDGYSKQSPDGMIKPTQAEIERLLEREVKKIR